MASTANSLRLCLRTSRQTSSAVSPLLRRALSTTTARCGMPGNTSYLTPTGVTKSEIPFYNQTFQDPSEYLQTVLKDASASPRDKQRAQQMLKAWEEIPIDQKRELQQLTKDAQNEMVPLRRHMRTRPTQFWSAHEQDPDLITDEIGEDDFEEDDIMAGAHGKLEEHREYREYARIAVWEMPLLANFAKKFEPPAEGEVLRFRYTSYMGEFHPADRKVVVEFCPRDLDLTEAQQLKLCKLAGSRYNPEKETIKMSCERFEHQAQNKRYLGDLIAKMITTAKDPTDTFEDIPLDTRHYKKKKNQISFPKEWYMTPERKAELEAQRKRSLMIDTQKRARHELVDGVQMIEAGIAEMEPVEELVAVKRGKAPAARPLRR
ncbi:mitochondrial ribosomal subunit protein-domain-containing protein [Podospora australis]|uniref:Mitochondrial ribosomal subunit protein-domain-containing protein n=1 Tax=Podospora australis TaxID=1536484 RepID=A0AAN6WZL1_9PEZI|nr:mitochondrial ribosomal subunit protein-domain-containing protein [Podospora australis]